MSEYYITGSPDYLEHHGILGMKWGVRRFQNPDGSLTPEGRARYGDVLTKKQMQNYIREYNLRTGSKKTINKNTVFKTPNGMYDYKGRKLRNADVEVDNPTEEKHTDSKPKNEHRMTDDEIRAANTRMQLELDYRQKMSQLNPKKVTMGQQFVDNLKADLVKDIPAGISGMVKNAIASAGNSKPNDGGEKEKKEEKRTNININPSTASDAEVKAAIDRYRNENTLKDLQNTRIERAQMDAAMEKAAQDFLSSKAFENVKDIKVSEGQTVWNSEGWGLDREGKKYKW